MSLKIKAVILSVIYSLSVRVCSFNRVRLTQTVTSVGECYCEEVYMYLGARKSCLSVFEDDENISISSGSAVSVKNGVITANKAGSAILKSDNKSVLVRVFNRPTAEPQIYRLVVYKASQTVTVYTKNSNGEYSVPVKTMVCSTGTPGENETPCKSFKTTAKYRWKLLYGPCYGQYCTSFSSQYLFHSLPYSQKLADTVYDYGLLGTKSSHGCVRLCARDAKWLYDNCSIGSTVEISPQCGEFTVLPSPAINQDIYSGWDPTDPSDANPYYLKGTYAEPVCVASCSMLNLVNGESVKISIFTNAKNYILTSDNSSVANVNGNVITARKSGNCTVFIMCNDGSCCKISVFVK